MGMPLIDFTDKRYTDLMLLFDNWFDMDNIVKTMRHIGLDTADDVEEYKDSVKRLLYAKALYPEMPLNDAYKVTFESLVDINSVSVEVIKPLLPNQPEYEPRPCGSCGGGQVR